MYELIPIGGGIVVGGLAAFLPTTRGRVASIAGAAVVLGVIAAVASGEIAESFAFVIWDVAQAALAATLTLAAILSRRRRAPSTRSD